MSSLYRRTRTEVADLVRLAVPLVAGLTTSSLLMITDTWMLGPLGAIPLAAASLTGSVVLILWAAVYGFMTPVGILIGRAFGAGDATRVASVVAHGRWLGLGIGIVLAALMIAVLPLLRFAGQPREVLDVIAPYWITMALVLVPYSINLVFKQLLDAVDRAWTGVAILSIAVVVNVPLNYALIHGAWMFPRLGLTGAAAATLVAESVALLAFWAYWRFAAAMADLRLAVQLRRLGFTEQSKEGVPMGLQYLAEGSSLSVAGVLIGLLGATALAANQIVFSVASVLYMLPLGMASAVAIRIAQVLGAGEPDRVQPIGLAAMGLVTLWTTLFTTTLIVAGADIAAAFIDDRAVIAAATAMFVAVGVMQIFDGIQSVSLGALRALLDNRWPTIVTLGAYWLLALPFGWLFAIPLRFGAAGFWGGFALGLAVAALLLLRRFLGSGPTLAASALTP